MEGGGYVQEQSVGVRDKKGTGLTGEVDGQGKWKKEGLLGNEGRKGGITGWERRIKKEGLKKCGGGGVDGWEEEGCGGMKCWKEVEGDGKGDIGGWGIM